MTPHQIIAKMIVAIISGFLFIIPVDNLAAQERNENLGKATIVKPESNAPPTKSAAEFVGGSVSLMSNREFWLSAIILIFGVFIIAVEYFLLRSVVREKTEEIARIYTVTLIIIGTLVLITSGFTNEQIAPALGLFGTIAGYLLGRAESIIQRHRGGEDGHDS